MVYYICFVIVIMYHDVYSSFVNETAKGKHLQIRYKLNGCVTTTLFYSAWGDQKHH